MAAMQLGVLCPEFRGDSWGGERCSLLLLVGSVGGRGGGRRTQKTTNVKRWG